MLSYRYFLNFSLWVFQRKKVKVLGFFLFWEVILGYRYICWYYLNFPFILYIFVDAYFDSDFYKNSNLTNMYYAFWYYLNQLIVYRKLLWPWQFIMLYIHLRVSPSLHYYNFFFFIIFLWFMSCKWWIGHIYRPYSCFYIHVFMHFNSWLLNVINTAW